MLEDQSSLLEDRENFVLVTLERYLVEQNLLKARLSGSELEDFKPVQKALGQLPHGPVGDVHYNEMQIEVENFISKIEPFTPKVAGKPVEIDFKISGFNLRGRLSEIAQTGLVNIRYARKKARDILTSWINHLALCHAAGPGSQPTSFLICKDSALQFTPVPDSKGLLANLLNLFQWGLEAPIHFFPATAYEYAARKLNKAGSDQAALAKAKLKWRGGESSRKYTPVESDDPYYDLCFRRKDPLDDEFKEIAMTVFQPILMNSKEIVL